MSQESKLKENLFLLEELYSEPKAIFASGLKPIDDIKDNCLIVLDTNALLSPYDVGKESLEKIREVYSTLAAQNRLVVPAHVAREFAENRPAKLAELRKRLLDRKSSFVQPTKSVESYHLLEQCPNITTCLRKRSRLPNKLKS